MEVLVDLLEIFYLLLQWVQIAHALVCSNFILSLLLTSLQQRHAEKYPSSLHLCWSSPNYLHLVDICSSFKIPVLPHLFQEDFQRVLELSFTQISALSHLFPFQLLLLCLCPLPLMSSSRNSGSSLMGFF